jgi:hypothetical protein
MSRPLDFKPHHRALIGEHKESPGH